LISYLGADFQNQGDRVYRLLGCELTYKGGLPKAGDTLCYDIHIDGYAEQGPIRLFFFHYDCRINGEVRLSVRNGQAGFFTDEELADSGGILWDPNSEKPESEGRLDKPAYGATARSFNVDQVRAFTEGRLSDCFGSEFALSDTHTATPRIPEGRLNFLEQVTVFDPTGGPWKRGYLRAETLLTPDEWFFDGHFKADPCMPGTLMLEGCYQALSFYIAAMGYTIDRDGWRFEPESDNTFELRCRGQVTPGAEKLDYEVFVEEVHDGPIPTLYADVLCTVDGLKAFHGKRLVVRLVPAYPLDQGWRLPAPREGTVAETQGVVFNYDALAACSWGRPSAAFGPNYAIFDGERRCPRLPGPPYHFMTRVSRLDAEMGLMKSGGAIEVEYDIPGDAWYFSENGTRSMPYAVLLEAALQPCGWFASYMGCALSADEDLLFRNLDGTATQHLDIKPDAGILTTRVKSTSVSKAGSMIIVGFEVSCHLGETLAYSMTTVFGFFNHEAFANQAGLPADEAMRARIAAPGNFNMALQARPGRYFDGELRLPGPMLMLPDRVSEFSPEGGKAGLGVVRTEIDVDGKDWFFKSHFFGDSVQPGSLGIEAMLQTLQFYMLHTGMGEGIENPRFEPILLGKPMTWKYRGQVTPNRKRVSIDAEILAVGRDDRGAYVNAEISYWVDGLRIYESMDIGMRIVSDFEGTLADCDETLDPTRDSWLLDHAPTWTVPALPMMSMVDRLAQGALARQPGRFVVGLENVAVHRWLGFDDGAHHLKVIGKPKDKNRVACRLVMWHDQHRRYVTVASGDVLMGVDYLMPGSAMTQAEDAVEVADPYGSGSLFHGPAFQILRELHMGSSGSSSILDAFCPKIPFGALNQGLLDGATHGIPHDDLKRWSERVPSGMVAYPRTLTLAHFYGPTPQQGQVHCETRFTGFEDENPQFPCFDLQLVHEGNVWAELSLVEVLFPKGKIGEAPGPDRRAFLRDRQFISGLSLSNVEGQVTQLTEDEVRASDWLAGTLARTYASHAEDPAGLARDIAVKEHVARQARVHPAWVHLEENGEAYCRATPLNHFPLETSTDGGRVQVRGSVEGRIDFAPIRQYWRERLNTGPWLGEDLFEGLLSMFLKSVVLENPETFEVMKGKGALFVGNHQTGVESLIFSVAVSALLGLEIPVFAKDSHSDSWIGRLVAAIFAKPGMLDPKLLILVKREDPGQVLTTMERVFGGLRDGAHGLLVHAAGTRSLNCRVPTEKLSATFVDKAVENGVPIIPVRFTGGLPIEAMESKIEFPIGYGKQGIHIGAPLWAHVLEPLSSVERKAEVLRSLHGVGETWEQEEPIPGDPALAELVASSQRPETEIVLDRALRSLAEPSADTKDLLGALQDAKPFPGDKERSAWLSTCATKILGGKLTQDAESSKTS